MKYIKDTEYKDLDSKPLCNQIQNFSRNLGVGISHHSSVVRDEFSFIFHPFQFVGIQGIDCRGVMIDKLQASKQAYGMCLTGYDAPAPAVSSFWIML